MGIFNIGKKKQNKPVKQDQIANLDDYLLIEQLKKLKSTTDNKKVSEIKNIVKNDLLSSQNSVKDKTNDAPMAISRSNDIPIIHLHQDKNINSKNDENIDITDDIENLMDLAERAHLINQNIKKQSEKLDEYLYLIKNNIKLLSQKQTLNKVKKK